MVNYFGMCLYSYSYIMKASGASSRYSILSSMALYVMRLIGL